jgi:hypothetical protein
VGLAGAARLVSPLDLSAFALRAWARPAVLARRYVRLVMLTAPVRLFRPSGTARVSPWALM